MPQTSIVNRTGMTPDQTDGGELPLVNRREAGLNTLARSQSLRVICQRRQKSVRSAAEKGLLKFSGTRMPNRRAMPIAISVNAEKFRYSHTPARNSVAQSHATG